MKNTITILLMFFSVALFGQNERTYSPAEIMTIHTSNLAHEGDLYYDATSDIVYIGLMDGTLTPIKNTDNQQVQTFNYDPATNVLTLFIEDGGVARTVNLDTLAQTLTDGGRTGVDQTIDLSGGSTVTFSVADNDNDSSNEIQDLDLNTTTNILTITDNGSATNIDLTPYLDNEDDQNLSDGGRAGNAQTIDINDGTSVTFSVADPDSSITNEIQDLDLNTTTNILTITDNGSATDIDLTPYLDNSDNQIIDSFAIVGSVLQLGIEDDVNGLQTVNLGDLQDADWFEVGGTHADDILDNIYSFGNVGINENNPQHALHVDSGDPSSAGPWAVIEGGSNVRSNVALQLYDEGTADNNENILEFAFNPNTGSASTLSRIRSNSVGNFHVNGADLTLESYSAPGTINANQLVLKNDGNVGIGTGLPAAKLDVDNGSVRFSDYGVGAYAESLPAVDPAVYHLAVDAQGDVVETNTVKSSKIFYPPAIVIDVSTITTGESIDLWQEYVDRYGTPLLASPSSAGAIPTYDRDELEYYVTDLDSTVFDNVGLDDNGVFTYDVAAVPAGNCTFINVVFVVK